MHVWWDPPIYILKKDIIILVCAYTAAYYVNFDKYIVYVWIMYFYLKINFHKLLLCKIIVYHMSSSIVKYEIHKIVTGL